MFAYSVLIHVRTGARAKAWCLLIHVEASLSSTHTRSPPPPRGPTGRYELLCPAKHEIVRLGSLAPTTRATMLPRAPKGWGWRTALLYDDLPVGPSIIPPVCA